MKRNDKPSVTIATFIILVLLPIGIGLLLGAGRGFLGLLILNASALFSISAVLIAHKGPSTRGRRTRDGKPRFKKPPSPRESHCSEVDKDT